MRDGIWLEVSRVRIEGKKVSVQVVGDKRDDKPAWWTVEEESFGAKKGQSIYRTIATGLDKPDQVVIAKLGPPSAVQAVVAKLKDESVQAVVAKLRAKLTTASDDGLTCNLIRIQTT